MLLRRLVLPAIFIGVTTLTGCSSMLGVGQGDYSCPGLPEGVHCMSAADVYAATDTKDYLDDKGERVPTKKSIAEGPATATNTAARATRPAVPTANPLPIRTQARVLRTYIAPYEDDAGFFHGSEYVFSEVESRKWTLSDGPIANKGSRAATPLISKAVPKNVSPLHSK